MAWAATLKQHSPRQRSSAPRQDTCGRDTERVREREIDKRSETDRQTDRARKTKR